jgi:threonine dehydrogenase-like Zn-dependent dehydrogenase
MRAVTWQGKRDVRVESVPDPTLVEPNDAIVKVTSTAICGSDLHLYEVLGPYLKPGDILGHEAMGVVEEVGHGAAEHVSPGDRVVVPFNISCGSCWMCRRGLYSQCETTQVRTEGKGAALFGYTSLYGGVAGGQAEYLRVPQAQFGPVKLPSELPDDRFLFLSDILPTAWQAVEYADVPPGGTLAVLGLGPVGQLCVRAALERGVARVIACDLVPERLTTAAALGIEVFDITSVDDVAAALRDLSEGRGPDAVIDAVGLEAHGSPAAKAAQAAAGHLPSAAGRALAERVGIDRLDALHTAIKAVRRGGTVSISGVYGGAVDPFPMMEMFDKGIQLRMGQCNVRRWTDELIPLALKDGGLLDLGGFATHHVPLSEAADAYAMFQQKKDGCLKVVLDPAA